MLKKLCLLLPVLLLLLVLAQAEVLPERDLAGIGDKSKQVAVYDSDTLKYHVYEIRIDGVKCYLTSVWMQSPGQQIQKATAQWRQHLALVEDMAKGLKPRPGLVINGSGYVSPSFPEIPDNYPGTSEDYYYTPLGSLTVTDGVIFRNLEGVPFYGLTLQQDGLHLHVGDDIDDILKDGPTQTWSFYEGCPMIQDHKSILDRTWAFAIRSAMRTIIGKMDDNNYVILTVSSVKKGLSVIRCTDFLMETIDPEWAYDLDGGPSSALLVRRKGHKGFRTIWGGERKDADIMGFSELEAAN